MALARWTTCIHIVYACVCGSFVYFKQCKTLVMRILTFNFTFILQLKRRWCCDLIEPHSLWYGERLRWLWDHRFSYFFFVVRLWLLGNIITKVLHTFLLINLASILMSMWSFVRSNAYWHFGSWFIFLCDVLKCEQNYIYFIAVKHFVTVYWWAIAS